MTRLEESARVRSLAVRQATRPARRNCQLSSDIPIGWSVELIDLWSVASETDRVDYGAGSGPVNTYRLPSGTSQKEPVLRVSAFDVN